MGTANNSQLTVGSVLTCIFLLVSPLVDVLAPVFWLAPPMLAALALAFWLASRQILTIDHQYGLMLVLVCVVCVPWLLSMQYMSSSTILHTAIVVIAASVYYLAVRSGVLELTQRRGALAVLKVLFVATVAVSAFVLVEFIGANLKIGNISTVIPRVSHPDFEALVFGVIYRARGTASEPGVMALYYDLALFLALPLLREGWMWRLAFALIVVPAYLCLLSTGSLVCVLAGCGVLMVRNLTDRFLRTGAFITAAILLASALWIAAGAEATDILDALVLDRVDALATESGGDVSGSVRRERFMEIGSVFADNPFGIGFGLTPGLSDVSVSLDGLYTSEGQISLLGTLLATGGLPAVAVALAILGVALGQAWSIPFYGRYLSAGGLALSAHHLTVSEYWLPFIWMFLAISSAWHMAARDDRQRAIES